MKHLLKKFWIVLCLAFIINIPLLFMGLWRTDQSVTLKGNLTNIHSLVEIDTEYKEKGSFSSIYVISFDRPTILQSIFVRNSKTSNIEPISPYYSHFTDRENYQMGQIQKKSSLMVAIITAYKEAKKKNPNIYIQYVPECLCVSYYFKNSPFKIEDKILQINEDSIQEDPQSFITSIQESKKGDIVTLIREDSEIQITLEDSIYSYCRWYPYYTIDYDTISPKIKTSNSNVGGPSGGLLQTLSIYNRLVEEDYTKGKMISGTGTMSINQNVGPIGGIQQKIYTAYGKNVDIFFCPKENYEEAQIAYNKLKNKEKMALVCVETFADAIGYLENV